MFDTHCHLNFKAFEGKIGQVVDEAKKTGVTHIVVPGTDVETSVKAVEVAGKFENVYAAVGIHPHHVYQSEKSKGKSQNDNSKIKNELQQIEELLIKPKAVAIGEVGVDRHYYDKTKYPNYQIDQSFMEDQKEFLKNQIDLAIKYDKSLILHNREAKNDMLAVLNEMWDAKLEGKTVFHCCEPDEELLEFAKKHKMFIGVDGDVTYRKDKQSFIKKIPLNMLVLETDSPFLHPEPLRSQPRGSRPPNEPKNLKLIADFTATLMNVPINQLIGTTVENSFKLFQITT